MKFVDAELLEKLSKQASESVRHRAHFNLHPELDDPVQRLCIAMEPDTYVRPHRHADPETWEVLLVLRGAVALVFFDADGTVTGRTVLAAQGPVHAVEFPPRTWHAPVSLETGTVVFEVKKGPYRKIAEENLASWAPPEGDRAAVRFPDWFRKTAVGDRIPPK